VIRAAAFAIFSIVFWFAALIALLMAATAPCGLAPGVGCDLEGPPWYGSVLATVGPLGVLIAAFAIYAGSVWLFIRTKKGG